LIIINIAIIDADLIDRGNHRFPNLASMKISGYYKSQNNNVILKTDYDDLNLFDKVFISKVFTETKVPDNVLRLSNVEYGGTGFYYDKAPFLPDEIEHSMPDYHLYDDWVQKQIDLIIKKKEKKLKRILTKSQIKTIENDFKYYNSYSIGFTSRFCFRGV
jgi:hypothetical protein